MTEACQDLRDRSSRRKTTPVMGGPLGAGDGGDGPAQVQIHGAKRQRMAGMEAKRHQGCPYYVASDMAIMADKALVRGSRQARGIQGMGMWAMR